MSENNRKPQIYAETHFCGQLRSTLRKGFVKDEILCSRPSWGRPENIWKYKIPGCQCLRTFKCYHEKIFPNVFHEEDYKDEANMEKNGKGIRTWTYILRKQLLLCLFV